ncbi:cytochrome P450 [Trichoderma citrinoviride]|uniref:Cytochrome P450 n=1 Tax=Trichoderma citrinoviride TaxID=58853 RepID=A0A2T4BFS8_9HYPO|nr:cytochrome P450 [Trichoderma citrinoviride]PTB68176.1 cytochrome P450 [Trichoderma citrinoviride]
MSTHFYLLGEPSFTAVEFDISEATDFQALQDLVGSRYAVVELRVPEVRAADGPVSISIDGNAIYPDHLGNHRRMFETYGKLFAVTTLGTKWHYTNDPSLATICFTESDFFTKAVIPGHPLHAFNLGEAGIFFGSTDSENWRVNHKFFPHTLGPKAVELQLQEAALEADHIIDFAVRARDGKGNKLAREQASLGVTVTGAGFSTTASLMSWLIYGLICHDGMQDRLLQELVDNNWDENTPTDLMLPGGYKMAKVSIVIMALHHIHNDSEHWDSPARFDPDRWDTERVKNRHARSFQPFGSEPRGCIVFHLALEEVKVFLPNLVYRYEFTLVKRDEAVQYDPDQVIIKPGNLYVRAERRVRWPAKSE